MVIDLGVQKKVNVKKKGVQFNKKVRVLVTMKRVNQQLL